MRKHWKRFLLMYCLAWLAAAAMATLALRWYAAEDFSLPDLTPIYLTIAVFGLSLTAIVALPGLLFFSGRFKATRSALLCPFLSALLVALVPAAASVVGVWVFESLPAGEATMLKDGDVLVTGGGADQKTLIGAELYQTAIGEFVPVGSMLASRERHSATLLADGRVLVTGGTIAQPSDAADLYDPGTRTFTAAARMLSRRAAHSSTLLKDGRALIAGGAESLEAVLRSMEIYDPVNNSFIEAGRMQAARYKPSAALLEDGGVMISLSQGR